MTGYSLGSAAGRSGRALWLNETLSLMANVRNLTDKTYYTGSGTTTSVLVGSPRAFTLELRAGVWHANAHWKSRHMVSSCVVRAT